ncbi:FadR/GntR family transcriptional regulator [Telmatospirillum sp. J64-1]|uniref:FadR/GntR family transcriptional regulator n=1 Tax=Telmatospirillum sp. J64-1 TaxID=2502183 RepID=UPI00115E023A|nr:FadR/GntR family transcriptional regulator [Telmatospirillum sp. J64-1]
MALLKSAISGPVTRNSHAFVVNELGTAIVGGEFPPGSLLPADAEFEERFGVSRTVLREAMKTLAAKGLIFPRARIGTRVNDSTKWNLFDADVLGWYFAAGITDDFLRHLCEMRLSFEPFAARLAAANAKSEEIVRLKELAHQMGESRSNEAFALADLDFHLTLLAASGNPFMYSVGNLIEAALALAFKLSSPAEDPDRRAEVAHSHHLVVEALEARDGDAATKAMEAVIMKGSERVTASIDAKGEGKK